MILLKYGNRCRNNTDCPVNEWILTSRALFSLPILLVARSHMRTRDKRAEASSSKILLFNYDRFPWKKSREEKCHDARAAASQDRGQPNLLAVYMEGKQKRGDNFRIVVKDTQANVREGLPSNVGDFQPTCMTVIFQIENIITIGIKMRGCLICALLLNCQAVCSIGWYFLGLRNVHQCGQSKVFTFYRNKNRRILFSPRIKKANTLFGLLDFWTGWICLPHLIITWKLSSFPYRK